MAPKALTQGPAAAKPRRGTQKAALKNVERSVVPASRDLSARARASKQPPAQKQKAKLAAAKGNAPSAQLAAAKGNPQASRPGAAGRGAENKAAEVRHDENCSTLANRQTGGDIVAVQRGGGRGLKAVQSQKETKTEKTKANGTVVLTMQNSKEQKLFTAQGNAHVETKSVMESKKRKNGLDGTTTTIESKTTKKVCYL
eukprot:gnl/TRDRNA2_/TRDRNA2_180461_c0_seq1.p1 gnl/TRDRNA2_/TRDRNA2_180461_c0~~gnl/TRDRNA2_/TRDRNA2_180461_c0_seq1.p1  ORF type:complete len:220 (+),score=65.68 gnl/TRDRNA2_/TRDRNA2_180461_c0_seq1:64-660(+)